MNEWKAMKGHRFVMTGNFQKITTKLVNINILKECLYYQTAC